ncbi:Uncharacterized protein GNX_3631 [Leptospira interrogans serovar Canicola]|nr:Uncharacterized protein A9P81_1719 [Leptospira interrogans serovar Copenhageni/Icterohaemorrhagiae]OCC27801.1 Uncharacterized protein GNX_3631 [Leptospira interrogans serovar Canicola]SIQ13671.1 hypothetical protein SAMN05421689_104182 [Leptospira interrogans]
MFEADFDIYINQVFGYLNDPIYFLRGNFDRYFLITK